MKGWVWFAMDVIRWSGGILTLVGWVLIGKYHSVLFLWVPLGLALVYAILIVIVNLVGIAGETLQCLKRGAQNEKS